jgi:hypothetical protein
VSFSVFWTDELVKVALECMGRKPVNRIAEAVAEFNRLTGNSVTVSSFKFGVYRATGRSHGAHMLPSDKAGLGSRGGKQGRASMRRDPYELEVDTSEFEECPQEIEGEPAEWNSVVPPGHSVKNVTTLLDRDGGVKSRSVKTHEASLDETKSPAVPPGHLLSGVTTALGPNGDVRWQWLKTRQEDRDLWDAFVEASRLHSENYAGRATPCPTPRIDFDEDLAVVYPPGDPHIGMLSWGRETGTNFDAKIASRELGRAIDLLVDRAPPGELGIFSPMGDTYHAEDDLQQTPRGKNKLDVDSRWAKNLEVVETLTTTAVDLMLQKHRRVQVTIVPGNHDPRMARALAHWTRAFYRNEPRVEVTPNENPFMYFLWGRTLLGWYHGDGAKMKDLGGIMAHDCAPGGFGGCETYWGASLYRYWLTGHVHTERTIELQGVQAESLRTLAPNDYWAHHLGYRSGSSIDAIAFSRRWGRVWRTTVDVELVRESLRVTP